MFDLAHGSNKQIIVQTSISRYHEALFMRHSQLSSAPIYCCSLRERSFITGRYDLTRQTMHWHLTRKRKKWHSKHLRLMDDASYNNRATDFVWLSAFFYCFFAQLKIPPRLDVKLHTLKCDHPNASKDEQNNNNIWKQFSASTTICWTKQECCSTVIGILKKSHNSLSQCCPRRFISIVREAFVTSVTNTPPACQGWALIKWTFAVESQ